ncbi:hypothetical protein ACFWOY_11285 [Streptomyces sp. NPDC058423]|uniref:hypothetical protein n=1 Tax=Streptomyces sp. NPDC058423 TaxID=3346490 RepID=UPI00364B5761
MSFPHRPPSVPGANPTGVYERQAGIPAEWAGRRSSSLSARPKRHDRRADGLTVGIGRAPVR